MTKGQSRLHFSSASTYADRPLSSLDGVRVALTAIAALCQVLCGVDLMQRYGLLLCRNEPALCQAILAHSLHAWNPNIVSAVYIAGFVMLVYEAQFLVTTFYKLITGLFMISFVAVAAYAIYVCYNSRDAFGMAYTLLGNLFSGLKPPPAPDFTY